MKRRNSFLSTLSSAWSRGCMLGDSWCSSCKSMTSLSKDVGAFQTSPKRCCCIQVSLAHFVFTIVIWGEYFYFLHLQSIELGRIQYNCPQLTRVQHLYVLLSLAHFALIKFQAQADTVPEGAPRYWAKRLIPPLEFGSMHAILFQMFLIPLTMSRYSIANLSTSKLNNYLPLDKALRIHIYLGYTMVSIVFLATLVFFAFFG